MDWCPFRICIQTSGRNKLRRIVEKNDTLDEIVTLEVVTASAQWQYATLGYAGGLGGLVLCLIGRLLPAQIAKEQVESSPFVDAIGISSSRQASSWDDSHFPEKQSKSAETY